MATARTTCMIVAESRLSRVTASPSAKATTRAQDGTHFGRRALCGLRNAEIIIGGGTVKLGRSWAIMCVVRRCSALRVTDPFDSQLTSPPFVFACVAPRRSQTSGASTTPRSRNSCRRTSEFPVGAACRRSGTSDPQEQRCRGSHCQFYVGVGDRDDGELYAARPPIGATSRRCSYDAAGHGRGIYHVPWESGDDALQMDEPRPYTMTLPLHLRPPAL